MTLPLETFTCGGATKLSRPAGPASGRRGVLVRGQRADRERVDVGLHQFAERGIHLPVAGQRRTPGERRADDGHGEMAAAVARAGMAGMAVAVVAPTKASCIWER